MRGRQKVLWQVDKMWPDRWTKGGLDDGQKVVKRWSKGGQKVV